MWGLNITNCSPAPWIIAERTRRCSRKDASWTTLPCETCIGYVIVFCAPRKACLDQHLIAIRSPGIRGNHVRSIRYKTDRDHLHCSAQSRSSAAQTRLSWHILSTVINCTVLHGTWWGGCVPLQHQRPVVHCAGRLTGAWMQGTGVLHS